MGERWVILRRGGAAWKGARGGEFRPEVRREMVWGPGRKLGGRGMARASPRIAGGIQGKSGSPCNGGGEKISRWR